MRTLLLSELKVGMLVRWFDHTLNMSPASYVDGREDSSARQHAGKLAMVVAVNPDKPGKMVGVAFKEKGLGHTCDGLVPDGHGFWAVPENLYLESDWVAHQQAASKALTDQKQIADLVAGFFA
jgi:hypothetical protein